MNIFYTVMTAASWQRLWQRCRDEGFLFTLLPFLYRFIPAYIFHAKGFIFYTLEPRESDTSRAEALGARVATSDDIHLLAQCGYSELLLAYWFERGASAWLIELEGELLGCYWLDSGERYELYDWLVIQSTPKDVWVLWWWVASAYRKQDFAYQLRILGVTECAHAGVTQMIGAVDMLNYNGRQGCEKMGCDITGRLFILRIFGLTFVRFGNSLHIGRWNFASVLELSMDKLL